MDQSITAPLVYILILTEPKKFSLNQLLQRGLPSHEAILTSTRRALNLRNSPNLCVFGRNSKTISFLCHSKEVLTEKEFQCKYWTASMKKFDPSNPSHMSEWNNFKESISESALLNLQYEGQIKYLSEKEFCERYESIPDVFSISREIPYQAKYCDPLVFHFSYLRLEEWRVVLLCIIKATPGLSHISISVDESQIKNDQILKSDEILIRQLGAEDIEDIYAIGTMSLIRDLIIDSSIRSEANLFRGITFNETMQSSDDSVSLKDNVLSIKSSQLEGFQLVFAHVKSILGPGMVKQAVSFLKPQDGRAVGSRSFMEQAAAAQTAAQTATQAATLAAVQAATQSAVQASSQSVVQAATQAAVQAAAKTAPEAGAQPDASLKSFLSNCVEHFQDVVHPQSLLFSFYKLPMALESDSVIASRKENFFRVNVFGYLLDNLNLMNEIWGREEGSHFVEVSRSSEPVQYADYSYFGGPFPNGTPNLRGMLPILWVEEKSQGFDSSNFCSRRVTVSKYASNQGDLLKTARAMKVFLFRRNDTDPTVYGALLQGFNVTILSMKKLSEESNIAVMTELYSEDLKNLTTTPFMASHNAICAFLALKLLIKEEAIKAGMKPLKEILKSLPSDPRPTPSNPYKNVARPRPTSNFHIGPVTITPMPPQSSIEFPAVDSRYDCQGTLKDVAFTQVYFGTRVLDSFPVIFKRLVDVAEVGERILCNTIQLSKCPFALPLIDVFWDEQRLVGQNTLYANRNRVYVFPLCQPLFRDNYGNSLNVRMNLEKTLALLKSLLCYCHFAHHSLDIGGLDLRPGHIFLLHDKFIVGHYEDTRRLGSKVKATSKFEWRTEFTHPELIVGGEAIVSEYHDLFSVAAVGKKVLSLIDPVEIDSAMDDYQRLNEALDKLESGDFEMAMDAMIFLGIVE